jgi:hypothetical protein
LNLCHKPSHVSRPETRFLFVYFVFQQWKQDRSFHLHLNGTVSPYRANNFFLFSIKTQTGGLNWPVIETNVFVQYVQSSYPRRKPSATTCPLFHRKKTEKYWIWQSIIIKPFHHTFGKVWKTKSIMRKKNKLTKFHICSIISGFIHYWRAEGMHIQIVYLV